MKMLGYLQILREHLEKKYPMPLRVSATVLGGIIFKCENWRVYKDLKVFSLYLKIFSKWRKVDIFNANYLYNCQNYPPHLTFHFIAHSCKCDFRKESVTRWMILPYGREQYVNWFYNDIIYQQVISSSVMKSSTCIVQWHFYQYFS